jgi:hypothetical protein
MCTAFSFSLSNTFYNDFGPAPSEDRLWKPLPSVY